MFQPTRFRRQCRLLRLGTLFVLVCLTLLLTLTSWPGPQLFGLVPTTDTQAAWLALIQASPAVGYLWALWAVQRALGHLATGALFHPTVATAMRQIGIGVLCGALIKVFAVTNLTRMITGGRGGYLYFDLAAIVLGVVGAALVLLAQLVDQARSMQAELDEIL